MIFPFTRWQQSTSKPFSSPGGSECQFKTIQVNEDKEHQLDLRWLEALSFPRSTFRLGAHGSSLGFERKSSHPRLSGYSCCEDQWQRLYHCYLVPTLEAGRLQRWVLTSPYLIHYNGQITINGEAIRGSRQTYLDSYQQLLQAEQSRPSFKVRRNLSDSHCLWLFCSWGAGLCDPGSRYGGTTGQYQCLSAVWRQSLPIGLDLSLTGQIWLPSPVKRLVSLSQEFLWF